MGSEDGIIQRHWYQWLEWLALLFRCQVQDSSIGLHVSYSVWCWLYGPARGKDSPKLHLRQAWLMSMLRQHLLRQVHHVFDPTHVKFRKIHLNCLQMTGILIMILMKHWPSVTRFTGGPCGKRKCLKKIVRHHGPEFTLLLVIEIHVVKYMRVQKA